MLESVISAGTVSFSPLVGGCRAASERFPLLARCQTRLETIVSQPGSCARTPPPAHPNPRSKPRLGEAPIPTLSELLGWQLAVRGPCGPSWALFGRLSRRAQRPCNAAGVRWQFCCFETTSLARVPRPWLGCRPTIIMLDISQAPSVAAVLVSLFPFHPSLLVRCDQVYYALFGSFSPSSHASILTSRYSP